MANQRGFQEEQRILTYIANQSAFSDTAISLAHKLGVSLKLTRRVLAGLASAGEVTCRVYDPHTEPVYFRYRTRDMSRDPSR